MFAFANGVGRTGRSSAADRLCSRRSVLARWIDSPETTRSTRRFICRPDAVAFEATGFAFPYPCAVTAFRFTPCEIR